MCYDKVVAFLIGPVLMQFTNRDCQVVYDILSVSVVCTDTGVVFFLS